MFHQSLTRKKTPQRGPTRSLFRGAGVAPLDIASRRACNRQRFYVVSQVGPIGLVGLRGRRSMVRIVIAAEAYAAIASILLPGTHVGPVEIAPNGQYRLWLPGVVVDRLARRRGHLETYSDVILRLAARGMRI
jgi:hypothetical protein